MMQMHTPSLRPLSPSCTPPLLLLTTRPPRRGTACFITYAASSSLVCAQAYMIVDFFMFLLPFTPGDYLFVGHHIMTTAYMVMSLQANRGGLSCLILMALGESTSLFQNSWLIARELRRDNQVSQKRWTATQCHIETAQQEDSVPQPRPSRSSEGSWNARFACQHLFSMCTKVWFSKHHKVPLSSKQTYTMCMQSDYIAHHLRVVSMMHASTLATLSHPCPKLASSTLTSTLLLDGGCVSPKIADMLCAKWLQRHRHML